ncbi:MAG: PPOX class F420-dependent oxidoreductase [Actinomycetota bacterium]
MSVFTRGEIEYLQESKLGRLATADAGCQPHVIPVTYFFNEEEDTIDVGGLDFGAGKKWRDVEENPKVAFLVDDVIGPPRRAQAVEVRGNAELHETGGEAINPRFPNFAPQFIRIRPTRIVSWGLAQDATAAAATKGSIDHNARDVG